MHRIEHRTTRGLVLIAAAAAFTLSACGSDDKSTANTAAATTAASSAATTASSATTAAPAASTATTVSSSAATSSAATTSAATTGATTAGSAGGTDAAAAITIKGFAFQIPPSVAAGSTVTIKNDDTAAHTFTDKGKAFDVKVAGGGTATLTAPAAGTYQVVCSIHPQMSGTLVVG